MLQDHGDSCPGTLMAWMQRLLGENEDEFANGFAVLAHSKMHHHMIGWDAMAASPIHL